jgi:hypothetical protein
MVLVRIQMLTPTSVGSSMPLGYPVPSLTITIHNAYATTRKADVFHGGAGFDVTMMERGYAGVGEWITARAEADVEGSC